MSKTVLIIFFLRLYVTRRSLKIALKQQKKWTLANTLAYLTLKSAITTRHQKRDLEIAEGTSVGASPHATHACNLSSPIQRVGEVGPCHRINQKKRPKSLHQNALAQPSDPYIATHVVPILDHQTLLLNIATIIHVLHGSGEYQKMKQHAARGALRSEF